MSTKKLTAEEFIKRAREIHGDLYGYDRVEYVNSQSKVEIFCKKHNEYFKQIPSTHMRGYNCFKCSREAAAKSMRKDIETFIKEADEKHSSRYTYEFAEYKKTSEKVIITCKKHGNFEQTPANHLKGAGCMKCRNASTISRQTKTTEQFIEDAIKIHGDTYSYVDTMYIKSDEKVEITCEYHGKFFQIPNNHLEGKGCPHCSKELAGWSKSDYIDKAKGRTCTFYTIRCFNEEEEFYKIGRTMNTIKIRYGGNTMPYEYEVISEVKGSAGFIWDLERDEKRKLKTLHYQPKLSFGGSETECFTDYKL